MRKLIAVALVACFSPVVLPQNGRTQVVESVVGGSACAASIGCGVVVGIVFLGGVGYYVLKANGRKYRVAPSQMEIHSQPIPQAGPRPDLRTQYNEPGKVETHAVTTADLCRRMEQKFLLQGRQLKLHRIRRTTNPGLRYDCEFIGEDAVEGWFHDRRGGR